MSIYSHNSSPFEPFVYLIGWSHLNKFYIGSSYGIAKNSHPAQLWITYFTSSKSVKEFRILNGEPDIIRVEKTFTNAIECRTYEAKLNYRMNVVKDGRFLNKTYGNKRLLNIGHSEETKEKMRIAALNRSEEIKEKMRLSYKNTTEETREKMRQKMRIAWTKRPPMSEETREKIRIAGLNRAPHSKETREKLRIAASNRKPITEETREKLRISHLNKIQSEETKEKRKNTWKLKHN